MSTAQKETIAAHLRNSGVSRRSFLQLCSQLMVVAPFGLALTSKKSLAQIAQAVGQARRPSVIWLHFQECTGGSESFIRASHPIVADALLDVINLNYQETLMAPSGFQAEKSLTDTMRDQKGKYILLVEGAVPTKDNGVYCMVRGKTAESILQGPHIPRPSFHPIKAFGFTVEKGMTGKALDKNIRFLQIESGHHDAVIKTDQAYLYFWPGGQTERAAIQISINGSTNDTDVVTLLVSPLTGKVDVRKGKWNMPRPRA